MKEWPTHIGSLVSTIKNWANTLNHWMHIQPALEIFRKMNDLVGNQPFLTIWEAYMVTRRRKLKALEYYFQALKLAEKAQDKTRIVMTLGNIGYILRTNQIRTIRHWNTS